LTASDARSRLAADYEHLLELCANPPAVAGVSTNWSEVRTCAGSLRRLAGRLRDDPAVRAQGVAKARILLVDSSSALHGRATRWMLGDQVRSALASL
jgi:hypothetical protein